MTKLRTFALFCAIIALAAGQEEQNVETQTMEPVSEEPVKLVHVLNPGEREYLSPNLIGLQNIAMTYLPLSMNFINIIDAFREVVNGVRYEILLNAVDTKDNDKEIICQLVILEKPWLTTEWGDKVRELRETNCTSDTDNLTDPLARSNTLNDKYMSNAIFNGGARNELNADEMAKLEAQIMLLGGSNDRNKEQQTTTTTTDTTIPVDETSSTTFETPTATPTPANVYVNTDDSNDMKVPLTTPTAATTTEKLNELTDDEKNWLDNIFSVGALNFEQQLAEKQYQRQQNQQQLNEQTLIKQNEASNYVQHSSSESLLASDAAAADQQFQYAEQQQQPEYDGQQQLQEALTFVNDYQQQQQQQEQQQPQHREPQDVFHRAKRSDSLVGGLKKLNLKEAENRLQASFDKLAAGDGPTYRIDKVHSATTQIVSGTLTRVDADIINSDEVTERCIVEIWSQPWLPKGVEVTFKCVDKDVYKVRHSRSIEFQEKKTHKKQDHHNLGKVEHLFNKFQVKFGRRYQSTMERQMRLRIFKQNLRIIDELNRNEMGSAKYGITEFADMTSSEYKMRTGLWQREADKPSAGKPAEIPNVELPKEFDWREKGVVAAVKDQGNCGSCWAFSVTGNLEGLNAIKTGQLNELSEQELLDCDTIDSACGGGLPDNAYKAIEDIGGLEYESEYPYKGRKNQCTFNKTMAHVKVKDFVDLPKNETAIAQWLITNGPISIGINANAMQFYRGGVSHPWRIACSTKNLDHGVLIVGYGVSEYPSFKKTLPYWIIKNSWGPKWGEQGYYRVYRGENTCGVSEMASSAVLA